MKGFILLCGNPIRETQAYILHMALQLSGVDSTLSFPTAPSSYTGRLIQSYIRGEFAVSDKTLLHLLVADKQAVEGKMMNCKGVVILDW